MAQVLYQLEDRHLPGLMALYARTWWAKRRSQDGVRAMLRQTSLVVGLEEEGRLVGFVRCLTDFTYRALIFDVMVAPDRRGRGLGRLLMERLISHPQLAMVRQLELYCLPQKVAFYQAFGFKSLAQGQDFVFMRLSRPASPPDQAGCGPS